MSIIRAGCSEDAGIERDVPESDGIEIFRVWRTLYAVVGPQIEAGKNCRMMWSAWIKY